MTSHGGTPGRLGSPTPAPSGAGGDGGGGSTGTGSEEDQRGTGSFGEDLSGQGKPPRLGLRGTFEAWLDSQEAWECAAVGVRLPRDEHARTWWLLLGDFFRVLHEGSLELWICKLRRQKRLLLAWQAESLLGFLGAGREHFRQGCIAPAGKKAWRLLCSTKLLYPPQHYSDSTPPASGEEPSLMGMLVDEGGHIPARSDCWGRTREGAAGDWLKLLQYAGAFRLKPCAATVVSWNVGPVGYDASASEVDSLLEDGCPVICLQDLRLSKRAASAVKLDLESRFPHYKVFISAGCGHQIDSNGRHYQFCVLTALHLGAFSGATGEKTQPTFHRARPGRSIFRGRLLVLKSTLLSGGVVYIINLYQFTAGNANDQAAMLQTLKEWVLRHPTAKIILAGDMNATLRTANGAPDPPCPDDGALQGLCPPRMGYADVAGRSLLRADEGLTQFIRLTAGHRSSCPFHTWLRDGKAAALDHVITWNLILDGDGFTKRAPGSHDHRQVMARVDSSLFQPSPRPPKPLYQGRLDPVAFSRNIGLWKRLCSEAGLEGGDGAEDEPTPPGPELYRRYCVKTQLMLKVSLTLQRKNEKRLRRARERPSDRSKQQRHWRNRTRLLQAALRDAIGARLNDPVTQATALAMDLLNLGSPSTSLMQLVRATTVWEEQLKSEIKRSHTKLTSLAKKLRIERNRQTLNRHRWIFEHGVKGMRRIMGRSGSQVPLTSARVRYPVGVTWEGSQPTLPLPEDWLSDLRCRPEVVTAAHSSSLSITSTTLSLVAPIIHDCIKNPPPFGGSPALVYEDGPWQGENLMFVVESFFQSNARGAFASCPKCASNRPVTLTYCPPAPPSEHAHPLHGADAGGQQGGSSHRRLLHFCEPCMDFVDFRHNRTEVGDMAWMDEAKIFDFHTIPLGERLMGPTTDRHFQRVLSRLPSRKAPGKDGIPAEILKNAPGPFQAELKSLVDMVMTGEYQLVEEALESKVVLLHKKSDPANLGNYRPVALLTSLYQLVNLIITDRLTELTEKYSVLQSGQYGFRRLRGVQMSAQRLYWLFKRARLQGGVLLQVNLDFKNAFNAAGHASIWAILSRMGVPDLELIRSLYEASDMTVLVEGKISGKIEMDTGTAQGSTLSPLLFDLFLNALLRLLEATGIGHEVIGVRDFNHLAFADDLSLLVSSEDGAENLLKVVKKFEDWSGLSIASSKSFLTGQLFGKGAKLRAKDGNEWAHRKKSKLPPKPPDDRVAYEVFDRDQQSVSLARTRPTDKRLQCQTCLRTRLALFFEEDGDNPTSCIFCKRDWSPRTIYYGEDPIPYVPGTLPTRFLGIHSNLLGDCSEQIAQVFSRTAEILVFLTSSPLTRRQNLLVIQQGLETIFRFSAGIVPWSDSNITKLDRMWMRAHKLAWGLSIGTADEILRYPRVRGGLQVRTPISVLAHTMWTHLASCVSNDDGLKELAYLEYREALSKSYCNSLTELQEEAAVLSWNDTIGNRFTHACFLLHKLQESPARGVACRKVKIHWRPFSEDSLFMRSPEELCLLLVDNKVVLRVPLATGDHRVRCSSLVAGPLRIQGEAVFIGTEPTKDPEGATLWIYASPQRGLPNAPNVRELITWNFPEAKTIHDLRTCIGLSPSLAAGPVPPSPDSALGEAADVESSEAVVGDIEDITGLDLDALEAQVQASAASAAGSSLTRSHITTPSNLSWSRGTIQLRLRRKRLVAEAQRSHEEEATLAMLASGEAIYTRALPILVGEGYDSLDKLPRTEEWLNPKGKPVIKAYFHVPPLTSRRASVITMAERKTLEQWLSTRDLDEWISLALDQFPNPRVQTIHKFAKEGSAPLPPPPVTNVHLAINKLHQMGDKVTAEKWWRDWVPTFDQHLQSLPPAVCEGAMTKITACWSKSADWRSEIKLTLDSLGFLRPDSNTGRPRKRRRDMDIPGSADPMAMGDALIAAVLGHRNTPGRYGLGGQVEFLCEVRAPPQARIECLLALPDHNLRAAIARGDDLICMPKAWWSSGWLRGRLMDRPLIPTDRMHRLEGWWVLGRSEVLVRKCYGCQRFRTEVSPNGCCAGCSKTDRTPPERAHPLEAGLLMRTAEPEMLDTEESGDTALTIAQLRACLAQMLAAFKRESAGPRPSNHCPTAERLQSEARICKGNCPYVGEDSDDCPPALVCSCYRDLPHFIGQTKAQRERSDPSQWRKGWFTTSSLGYPLLDDTFDRPLHPALAKYILNLQSLDEVENQWPREMLRWHYQRGGDVDGKQLDDHQPATPLRVREWEQFAVPLLARNPARLPDRTIPDGPPTTLLSRCHGKGVVKVLNKPVYHEMDWLDAKVVVSENVAHGVSPRGSFSIEGAKWYLLRTLVAPRLADQFVPTLLAEIEWQVRAEERATHASYSWPVLRAAQAVLAARVYFGGSMVSAPPFFDAVGRDEVLFWGTDSGPTVYAMADWSDGVLGRLTQRLQSDENWIVLTPSVKRQPARLELLRKVGACRKVTKGKASRQRGWWRTGKDLCSSCGTKTEVWISRRLLVTPEISRRIDLLVDALENDAKKETRIIGKSAVERIYLQGSEAGLLGVWDDQSSTVAFAGDGSLEGGAMGAGVYCCSDERLFTARVGRAAEGGSSNRPEAGAACLALRKARDDARTLVYISDSGTLLTNVDRWIGEGSLLCMERQADEDILREIVGLLHHRTAYGYSTVFLKVKSHRGEPSNEMADRAADRGRKEPDSQWDRPSGRLLIQWETEGEDGRPGHNSARWGAQVKKLIRTLAASTPPTRPKSRPSKNYTSSFLDRVGWSQDLLGEYLADKRVQESATRRLLQSLSHQFPCKAVLFRNRLVDSPRCPHCLKDDPMTTQIEHMGHIQCWCPSLKSPRIAAHHSIWRLLMSLIKKHSRFSARPPPGSSPSSSSDEEDPVVEEAAVAGSADTEAMSAMMESEESSGVGMGIATGDESAVKGGRKGSPTLDDSEEAMDIGDPYADRERKIPEPPPAPAPAVPSATGAAGLPASAKAGEARRRRTRFSTCSFPTATSDTDHSELTIAQTIAHIAPDLADMGSLSKKALDFLQTKGSSSNDEAIGNFLNKRPDGIALLRSEKRVVLLEFTRAMDTDEDFQSITEKRKTARYALHCEFIASLLNSSLPNVHDEEENDLKGKAWSVTQINFTVGVRGSLHEQSFKVALTSLGVTDKRAQETIRKATVRRTLEVHDLMLKCYYRASHGNLDWSTLGLAEARSTSNSSSGRSTFLHYLQPA